MEAVSIGAALFLFYKPSVSYPSIREKIVEFFSQIRTSEHILLGFSSLLIAVSVFLSPWFAAKSAVRMSDPKAALFYFKKAVHRNPVHGHLLQNFGMFLSQTGENEPAERLIRAGIKYNRISSVRYKTYAEWLLANGQKDRGIDTLRTAISLNVKKSRSYIDFMDETGLNINEIRNALPHRVEPRIYLAEFLSDKGMQGDAERPI